MSNTTSSEEAYVHSVIAGAVAGQKIPKPEDSVLLAMPSLAVAEATKAILAWNAKKVEEARMQGFHEGRAAANNPEYQYGYGDSAHLSQVSKQEGSE